MGSMESDLDRMLKHHLPFTDMHLVKLTYNTLCCINFLHEANVLHRDIKSANILINSDCSVKLCDFGLARSLP